jgi:hypothetical protein
MVQQLNMQVNLFLCSYDDEGSVGGLNGTPRLMNIIAH